MRWFLKAGLILTGTLLALFGTLSAASAWSISGTVHGGSNTTVTLTDAGTSTDIDSTAADATGRYNFTVSNGTYNLKIDSIGFDESAVNGIVVSGADVIQNVVLVSPALFLSGKVTTPGGVGISKVALYAYDQASGTSAGSQATDVNGNYTIPVASGNYKINIYGGGAYNAAECGGFCISNVPVPQEYGWIEAGRNVSVTTATTRNFTLPLVTLSGKTTDSTAVAVGDVVIKHSAQNYYSPAGGSPYDYYWSNNSHSSFPIKSDGSGNYSITLLADDTASVTLVPPAGSGLTQTSVSSISVLTDTIRDFAIPSGFILSGKVTTPGGVGISNVVVHVFNQATGSVAGLQATDANGDYGIAVASGTYKINLYGGSANSWAECGGYCVSNVAVPQEFGWIDAAYSLAVTTDTTRNFTLPLVTLGGQTTDSTPAPVGDVIVKQFAQGNYFPAGGSPSDFYWSNNNHSSFPIKSTGAGNYSITLLADDTMSVTLVPPAGSGLAQTSVSNVSVLTDTSRDFAIPSGFVLSGNVQTPSGVGINKVVVHVLDQATGSAVGSQATDASGNYSIAVPPGTYKINLYGGGAYSAAECGGFCLSAVAVPQEYGWIEAASNLSVTANVTQDFTLPLVTLSGKTTDSNGVPVGDVTIRHFSPNYYSPAGGSPNDYYWSNNSHSSSPIKSDASGTFSITLLADDSASETIIPPAGSGFAQTAVSNIDASQNLLQNIILGITDSIPPVIVSGPTVTTITRNTASVEWQTSEPTKGGVRYGTSDPPGTAVNESGYVTSHSLTLTGLSADTTYYVSVFGSDSAANAFTPSSAVSFRTLPLPDTIPPVIVEGPTVTAITHAGATVTWKTNEPSTGVISYGATSAFGQTVSDPSLGTDHSVTLSGLNPKTFYRIKLDATDAADNGPTTSSTVTFTTLATPDTLPPVIVEGPLAINFSDIVATIAWQTDEPATSGVSLNDGTNFLVYTDNTLTTEHTVLFTGLTASTTYSYTVSSKDGPGNGPTLSVVKTFTTRADPDTRPPVFTQTPIVRGTTEQSVNLYLETDEPARCTIQYGTSPAFGATDVKLQLLTKHNRSLTGLLPGTTYYFRVQATDAPSNTSTSETFTFTTDILVRTTAPVITEVPGIIYSTDTKATIGFTTDRPCDTVLNYGPGGTFAKQQSNSGKVTTHQMTLTNLVAATSYSVRASCTDMTGNTVVAADIGFTTPALPDTTPPVIPATPTATAITSTTARIVWSTDEITDSQVFFGLTSLTMSGFDGDISQATSHSVALTNLTPGTTYYFKVRSTDPANNTTASDTYSFTTAALPDTTPPIISSISASGVTSSRINVSWSTNEPSTTILKYGTSPTNITGQVAIAGLRTDHSVTLYNLVPGTTCYLAPVSSDSSGNSSQGAYQTVTLTGVAPSTYTVTATAGGGGSITPATRRVNKGERLALTVVPQAGYLVYSATGCIGALSGQVYTTTRITENCTVAITFTMDPANPGMPVTSTATPPSGSYSGGVLMVQLKSNSLSAAIYYTTDGSTPSTSSSLYTAPVQLTGTTTVKYFAKDGATAGDVKSATYMAEATGQPSAGFGSKPGTTFTVYRSEGGRAPQAIYSGSETSFTDTDSLKPNTIYTYSVSSDAEGVTDLLTIRTPLYNGWNSVGVPYNTVSTMASDFFAGVVNPVYEWLPTGATMESDATPIGSFAKVSILTPGKGYFVETMSSDTLLTYSGAPNTLPMIVTLRPGWTMISNPGTSNMTNIGTAWKIDGQNLATAVTAGTIGGSLYWWTGSTFDFWTIGSNPLVEPWKGYWIVNQTSSNHTLTIQ